MTISCPKRALLLAMAAGLLSCAAMRPPAAAPVSPSYVPLALQLSWRPAPPLPGGGDTAKPTTPPKA
ncbi:MAG: hypothetical protein QM639_20630, partial [Rhodocyclaceae bacterium]